MNRDILGGVILFLNNAERVSFEIQETWNVFGSSPCFLFPTYMGLHTKAMIVQSD